MAVTAKADPVRYVQPDGSVLTIRLLGDERIRWAETADGYTILPDRTGRYVYAVSDKTGRMTFSGQQAHDPGDRSPAEKAWLANREKGIFFSEWQLREMKDRLAGQVNTDNPLIGGFPATGTRKLLMVLANFSNTATGYGPGDFQNYMNQPNYSGTGSFRDYFIEVSYGQLVVNTTVTVWVTVPYPHDYYGPDSTWGQFAYHAIVAAENQAGVNFAEYDNNLDGVVDGVAIIHQGQGQEETGNPADIWSHSWDLTSAGFTAAQRLFDGVLVNAYTTMPERNATGMGTIGVMCHEFCHNLGAPDFYDTDYSAGGSYTGTGKWDLMAGGSWNGVSGNKPAHPNPWIKAYFNWVTPVTINSIQGVTLRNAQAYPDVVRYNTQTPNEYFLCENRQQTGFDNGLPGHGLMIYHVDGNYIAATLSTNKINAGSHQGLYPVCANATGNPPSSYGTINGTGCPFPGTGNKAAFTDATLPNAKSWAGVNTGFPVTGIYEYVPSQEVSFCFINCSTPADPVNFSASPLSTSQVSLGWALNSSSNPVMIAVNNTPAFGVPADGTIYPSGSQIPGGGTVIYSNNGLSFIHPGLSPSTTYYYKAWSVLAGNGYSPGVTSRATTLCGAVSTFPWTEGFENSGAPPGCWTQEQVGNSTISWNFTVGNGGTYPAAAHTGCYNACLKDKTAADTKTRLVTPALNLTGLYAPRLTFWHTQALWGIDQDQLSVLYKTSANGTWTLLATYTSNLTSWTQETLDLPNAGSTYYIAFEGNAKFGYGICLDDVTVQSGCAVFNPVGITINTSMNPIYQGTMISHAATAVNGGNSPGYQWKINGMNISGATGASYTHIPSNNEEITCVLTSNANCVINNPALSNSEVITVSSYPNLNIVQNLVSSDSSCFDALQTIVAGGNGTSFLVENDGHVTMVAGQNIRYLPGSQVIPGGYLHGFIMPGNPACGSQTPSPVAGNRQPGERSVTSPAGRLSVYPNPARDEITVAGDFDGPLPAELTLYDMTGKKVLTGKLKDGAAESISLRNIPAGILLLQVRSGSRAEMVRIIKQ